MTYRMTAKPYKDIPMAIETVNPTTGQILKIYQEMSLDEVIKLIGAAHQAFLDWKEKPLAERTEKIRRAGKVLLKNKQDYATLITQEMGKPIKAATAEIEKCAWLCQHFADHADEYLKPRFINTEMSKSYVTYQPLGVIFAIMPWNFPFWQVFRFAVPALIAGNGGLLKHAPTTTGCGLAIERIFNEADFPANLFQTIIINTDLAKDVITNPLINGVTLTGSVKAGETVGSQAVKNMKKVVLELGGSDPYIILEDADLDYAVAQCVTSRLNNSGQTCIAAKRLIVVDAVREDFEKKVVAKAKTYKMGDPFAETTQLGPLARADLRDTVQKQVEECITKGAESIYTAESISGPGFFYPVTVLKNIHPEMPAYDEEIFGPVIAILNAKDEEEAVRIANDSSYGLGAAVFTKNVSRGEKIARQLAAGTCCVNTLVSSDPRLPFGGIKFSGFGRELGAEGIHEFTNIKTISIK